MRFLKYLELSSDKKDDALFRSLNIGLVRKPTPYKKIVEEKDKKALELIESLNMELQKSYKGKKYLFDFIVNEKSLIDDLKLNNKRLSFIKKICLDFNDKLAEIQTEYEQKLKTTTYKK